MTFTNEKLAYQFEKIILRPLFILFIALMIFFVIKSLWFYLIGFFICLCYLGAIGSKLHPLLSASDLAEGPLKRLTSVDESELTKYMVGNACTQVGILVGLIVGVISWASINMHWYFAIIIGWFTIVIVGASLKVTFKII